MELRKHQISQVIDPTVLYQIRHRQTTKFNRMRDGS
jgi:hypothetical protein